MKPEERYFLPVHGGKLDFTKEHLFYWAIGNLNFDPVRISFSLGPHRIAIFDLNRRKKLIHIDLTRPDPESK